MNRFEKIVPNTDIEKYHNALTTIGYIYCDTNSLYQTNVFKTQKGVSSDYLNNLLSHNMTTFIIYTRDEIINYDDFNREIWNKVIDLI